VFSNRYDILEPNLIFPVLNELNAIKTTKITKKKEMNFFMKYLILFNLKNTMNYKNKQSK
jgi:hypothetical protein